MPRGSLFKPGVGSELDRNTGCVRTIEELHALIHEGCVFVAVNVPTDPIAVNAYWLMELIVPAGVKVHLKAFRLFVTGLTWKVRLTANPTLTTGATAIIPRNKNREKADDSVVVVKANPTSVSGGTVLDEFLIGGAANFGQTTPSIEISIGDETILTQGTYLISLQNLSAGASPCSIKATWYEIAD